MELTQSTTARALVSYGPYNKGGWRLKDNLTLRPLRDNELLVEVVASGICQTDLHFAGMDDGFGVHYPRVMGHEGSGYVRQVGQKVTAAKVNDPILMSFSSCKSCECCRKGHPAHCHDFDPINFVAAPENLVFKDGEKGPTDTDYQPDIFGQFFGQSSFANWSIVREESIVNVKGLVEKKEDLHLMAPLGCGIQTGAGAVINAAQAHPEDRVAVIGLGGVGLSAVMGARIAGCTQVIAIARNEVRLKLALELGATHVVRIDSAKDLRAVTEAVREVTAGLGANITLDTTGVPALIAEAVRMTAFKGTILQLGTAPAISTLEIPIHEFMVSGKRFQGVVEGDVNSQEFVPTMVEWVKSGLLPVQKMVGFYQASDFDDAIQDMHSGKTVKPVILW
ncbi:hypothetical protein BDW74DRAFT_188163 [Aspergillus multicolor]|uniref:NAD(P)-dependent alcohol dehydrogenase n=1 Tax=Aspergillus multicolor TaxID=41759 RepID=UPI003CCE2ED8